MPRFVLTDDVRIFNLGIKGMDIQALLMGISKSRI